MFWPLQSTSPKAGNNPLTSRCNFNRRQKFGTLSEIKHLIGIIGEKTVKELFLNFPKKIYTAPALYFIKNFILHIPSLIDEQKYLKFTPRNN